MRIRAPRRVAAVLSLCGLAWLAAAPAADGQPIPPPPARHFNDYAGLVAAAEADRLDAKLRAFEQQQTSQIVVAIFPALPEAGALEEYTARTAQAWRVGEKGRDNGAVLFVFVRDRKLRLEVGYGLEARLPDAIAKRIIEDEIAPGFRAGQPAAGLDAGIEAIFRATRGEYQPRARSGRSGSLIGLLLIIGLFVFLAWLQGQIGPTLYSSGGWHTQRRGRLGYWGSGGFGGGFGSGGGGGGFSGGGGRFGGGGALGSW